MAATQTSERGAGVFRMAKGFSVRTYEPPPDDFDPLAATDKQLLHHGLPRRPDAAQEPEWRAAWERALARPTKWIAPEFQEVKGRSHGPIRPAGRKKLPSRAAAAELANATSGNWSGAADFSAKGKPYKWVAGQWTVPNPHAPGSGSYYASEWVGIDGWGSADVLQAGTETEVIEVLWFTITSVYAWWEWFPAGEVAITNLPVSAGDVMYCLICVNSATSATVYFSNQSTGISTSFTITAPSGTTLSGNVAEWIVERPTVGGSVASLTDYDAIYFDECLAGWAGGGSIGVDDLSSATSITMTGSGGADLSDPTIENNHLLKVAWRKAS
jgi:peptidase A4-like protein